MIFHDETAFNANDDETKIWAYAETNVNIKSKGKGSGLMVSDFIDEHNGYLRLTQEEIEKANTDEIELTQTKARQEIEYGVNRDGYWNSPKFMT